MTELNWAGVGGSCGEYWTGAPHRVWCFDCREWWYPKAPCVGCDRTAEIARLRKREAAVREYCAALISHSRASYASYLVGVAAIEAEYKDILAIMDGEGE